MYNVVKKGTIECSDCDRPLLDYVVTDEHTNTTKVSVECPYCGGSSFLVTMVGPYRICPVDGLILKNVENSHIQKVYLEKI